MKSISTILKKQLLPIGLCTCLMASTLSGCGKNNAVSFQEYTQNLFLEEIAANTLNLHYCVEDPAAFGITDYDITLGDYSMESRQETASYLEETLGNLESYTYSDLTLEEQLTYDVLTDYLNTQLKLCSYDLYEEPLSFSGGLQMELPILLAEYEFNNEQDVKDYLKLIALVDEYFSQIMEFEAEKSDKGLFMSDTQCELVIDSCEAFLENKEDHYLLSTFERRLAGLDLSKQKVASYLKQNKTILEKQLFPAYEEMISALENLLGTGTNEGGICHFEDGKEYYELLVYSETGCEDSIDVIFERIETQRMKDLVACASLQQTDSTIMEQCMFLEWEMEDPEAMISCLQEEILEAFPNPPESECVINYVDPALEEYLAPAFYIVAPIDNYDENVIYINEGYVSSDIYAFTTMAHEGYPGHLYQTVMTYEYEFPNVRSILNYSGYVEGWATYIEMMSYYYAGLDENVASFLSHNQAATLSLYASSDIGLHYYGWSMEDLYEFWEGYGITNRTVIKEIAQLILSEPGDYLKYYVGYIEFLELKEYAKEHFNADFSEKAFHHAVLDIGPAPFSILEEYLEEYYSPQT